MPDSWVVCQARGGVGILAGKGGKGLCGELRLAGLSAASRVRLGSCAHPRERVQGRRELEQGRRVARYLVMPLIVAAGGGNMVHTVGQLTDALLCSGRCQWEPIGSMFRGMHHVRVSSSTALRIGKYRQ
jgi:hypothetical protein